MLDDIALLTFFLHATTSKSLSITAIILEDWSVIEVLEGRNTIDNSLTIVADLGRDSVSLQIENLKVGHVHEDLFKGLFIVNLVVLEIDGRQTRALKESTKVIDAISTNSVSLEIKTVELS